MHEPAPIQPLLKSALPSGAALAPRRWLAMLMAEGAAVVLRAIAVVLLVAPLAVLACLLLR